MSRFAPCIILVLLLAVAVHKLPAVAGPSLPQGVQASPSAAAPETALLEARRVGTEPWEQRRAAILKALSKSIAGNTQVDPTTSDVAQLAGALDAAHGMTDEAFLQDREELRLTIEQALLTIIAPPQRVRHALRAARKASDVRWSGRRQDLLDGFDRALPAEVCPPAMRVSRLHAIGADLDRARAMTSEEYTRGEPGLLRALLASMAARKYDGLLALRRTVACRQERWPAVRAQLLARYREHLEKAFPDQKEAQSRLAAIADALDSMRGDGRSGLSDGQEEVFFLSRLTRALSPTDGVARPARGRRAGIYWSTAVLLCLLCLPLIQPSLRRMRNPGAIEVKGGRQDIPLDQSMTAPPPAARFGWLPGIARAAWLVVAAELICRLVLGVPPVLERMLGEDGSSRRLAWIGRHEGSSTPLDDGIMVHHPARGWAVTPMLRNASLPVEKTVNSNSRGQRGVKEYATVKPAGTVRILVLGDSYTFGAEADDEETYPYLFEKMTPGTEVINCGVIGYGHDQMLLYLREMVPVYHPDIVLLGFVSIDVERNAVPFTFFAKPYFRLKNGRLTEGNTPVPTPAEILQREPWQSGLWDVVGMFLNRIARIGETPGSVARPSSFEITTALLDEIAETARSAGATPAFVYLPWALESEGRAVSTWPYLQAYCEQRKALCTTVVPDVAGAMARGDFRRVQRAPRHWTGSDARVIAAAIRAWLWKSGLVKRPGRAPAGRASSNAVGSLRCASVRSPITNL